MLVNSRPSELGLFRSAQREQPSRSHPQRTLGSLVQALCPTDESECTYVGPDITRVGSPVVQVR